MIRSWLFVPGDSERKITRALASDADAVIIDWEDAVADSRKNEARELLGPVLAQILDATPQVYVRVNGLDTPHFDADIEALPARALQGVVLPKLYGPDDVYRVSAALERAEHSNNHTPGGLSVVGVATESAAGVMALTDFRGPVSRLSALMWGGEDLAADLGILKNRHEDGSYKPVFHLARDMLRLAAGAARCDAIDAVYVDYRDTDGLRAECQAAKSMGFTGKAAIHPAQVPIINAAFTPEIEEREWAERVLKAFDAGTGVATLDGRMIDAPHAKMARRILGR